MEPQRPQVTPFLMFEGAAERAIDLYLTLFEESRVESLERFGPEGPGPEGTVYRSVVVLGGQRVMFFDSPAKHAFAFTPAISLFATCRSREEIDRVFAVLAEGGEVLMPLDEYPFSPRFGWVQDRFGVSWQLDLSA